MWTRAELKSRAKACLRKYYWMALVVSLAAVLLGGGGLAGSGFNGGSDSENSTALESSQDESSLPQIQGELDEAYSELDGGISMAVIALVLVTVIVIFVAAMLWSAFMGSVVEVGSCRFFMESRAMGESAGFGRLFWCFQRGKYLNVVKVMFLRNLFISLWTLLFIVPGVIKYYQYAMVPYILSENPNMNYRDALDLSRRMMDGEKFRLFVLQLSFIGWEFLGALLCGVGIIFVLPYINATIAELYAVLRKGSGAEGSVLPGYGDVQEAVTTDYQMY